MNVTNFVLFFLIFFSAKLSAQIGNSEKILPVIIIKNGAVISSYDESFNQQVIQQNEKFATFEISVKRKGYETFIKVSEKDYQNFSKSSTKLKSKRHTFAKENLKKLQKEVENFEYRKKKYKELDFSSSPSFNQFASSRNYSQSISLQINHKYDHYKAYQTIIELEKSGSLNFLYSQHYAYLNNFHNLISLSDHSVRPPPTTGSRYVAIT